MKPFFLAVSLVVAPGFAVSAETAKPGATALFVVGRRECTQVATGCALTGPHGALASEKNLVAKLQGELPTAVFWGGTTFRCRENQENADDLAKSAKSYKSLGAVALGGEDALLPSKTLTRVARTLGKKLVLTNVKPVGAAWVPSVDVTAGTRIFRLFAVVGEEAKIKFGTRWSDPLKALETLKVEPSVTNVVFVSSRNVDLVQAVSALPGAHVVVDAEGALYEWPVAETMPSGNALASLPERARYGHAMQFDAVGKLTGSKRLETVD